MKTPTSSLTGLRKTCRPDTKTTVEPVAVLPGLQGRQYVLDCTYGHYPWDAWQKAALAAGVDKDLAGLGRLTMREAFQHAWDDRLQSLCGWRDQGRRMTRLALRSPETARRRRQRLLDTDGYRGEYDERTGEWKSYH